MKFTTLLTAAALCLFTTFPAMAACSDPFGSEERGCDLSDMDFANENLTGPDLSERETVTSLVEFLFAQANSPDRATCEATCEAQFQQCMNTTVTDIFTGEVEPNDGTICRYLRRTCITNYCLVLG